MASTFGLKYMLIIGMLLTIAGVLMQNLTQLALNIAGSLFINLGELPPLIALAYLKTEWFGDSQQLSILAIWRIARVGGQALAVTGGYYYFHLHEAKMIIVDKQHVVSEHLPYYMGLAVFNLLLIIFFVKSKPTGLERVKKVGAETFLKVSMLGKDVDTVVLNPFLGKDKSMDAEEIAAIVSMVSNTLWNRLWLLISGKYFWLFGIGHVFPLAVTGINEIHILKTAKLYGISHVSYHSCQERTTRDDHYISNSPSNGHHYSSQAVQEEI